MPAGRAMIFVPTVRVGERVREGLLKHGPRRPRRPPRHPLAAPPSAEDYLQGFGRARGDGDPAVAVVFTRRNDDGLPRFMAEKTSRFARDEDGQATAALEALYPAIEQMKQRASDRSGCFRKATCELRRGRVEPVLIDKVGDRSVGRARQACIHAYSLGIREARNDVRSEPRRPLFAKRVILLRDSELLGESGGH